MEELALEATARSQTSARVCEPEWGRYTCVLAESAQTTHSLTAPLQARQWSHLVLISLDE